MAVDKDHMTAEEAHTAIEEAANRRPQLYAIREKLQKMAEDEERGLRMIAEGIRKLLHQQT